MIHARLRATVWKCLIICHFEANIKVPKWKNRRVAMWGSFCTPYYDTMANPVKTTLQEVCKSCKYFCCNSYKILHEAQHPSKIAYKIYKSQDFPRF